MRNSLSFVFFVIFFIMGFSLPGIIGYDTCVYLLIFAQVMYATGLFLKDSQLARLINFNEKNVGLSILRAILWLVLAIDIFPVMLSFTGDMMPKMLHLYQFSFLANVLILFLSLLFMLVRKIKIERKLAREQEFWKRLKERYS